MPPPGSALVKKAIVPDGGTSTQQAVSAVSAPIIRTLQGVFYKGTVITDLAEATAYDELITILQDLTVPPCIKEYDLYFEYKKLSGGTYQFSTIINIPRLKKEYAEGRVCLDYPITGSILSTLAPLEALKEDAKLSIPKIILGYIAAVAIVLPDKTAVEQYDMVAHLKNVIEILIETGESSIYIDQPTYRALQILNGSLTEFLTQTYKKRDIEYLPRAIEQCARLEIQITTDLFWALLTATEGGNKKLTRDYDKIAAGILEDGSHPKVFHPNNPFQSLLQYAAYFIKRLHSTYQHDIDLQALALPSEEEIRDYIAGCLRCGIRVFNKRFTHADDPVVYFLEQKKETTGDTVWAGPDDNNTIQAATEALLVLADWFKLHLCLARTLCIIQTLLSYKGQQWLAVGQEADCIQSFVRTCHGLLTQKYQPGIVAFNHYLQSFRRADQPEVGLLALIGRAHQAKLDDLKQLGLEPLLDIKKRFKLIEAPVEAIRCEFFRQAGVFLNNAGYGFELPIPTLPSQLSLSACCEVLPDSNKEERTGARVLVAEIAALRSEVAALKKRVAILETGRLASVTGNRNGFHRPPPAKKPPARSDSLSSLDSN